MIKANHCTFHQHKYDITTNKTCDHITTNARRKMLLPTKTGHRCFTNSHFSPFLSATIKNSVLKQNLFFGDRSKKKKITLQVSSINRKTKVSIFSVTLAVTCSRRRSDKQSISTYHKTKER